MKINVVFAWPILTTIFTIFLYWSASWYYIGYVDFYNYTLNVFDLPLGIMLIEGLTRNVTHVLYLITILILISFVSSVNKEQWTYFIYSVFAITLSILVFMSHLLKPLFKFIPNFGFSSWLRSKTSPYGAKIKGKLRNPARFLILCGHRTFRFLKRNNLTEADARRASFTSTPPSITFSFALFFHYFGLVLLCIGLLLLFKSAQSLAVTGLKEAETDFKDSKKLPVVLVKDRLTENLRNTQVCFKGSCLITDEFQNVKLHDMKDVEVINLKNPDNKKAP